MIGLGNNLLKMLRYIVNEFIENVTLTEVTIRLSIPVLRNIIAETATKRDEWDEQIRSAKVKAPDSIETKMFKVLKTIGVELSAYHGGSLNGKDIKKVMNNATCVFDQLKLIFEDRKRSDCLLTNDDIKALCLH